MEGMERQDSGARAISKQLSWTCWMCAAVALESNKEGKKQWGSFKLIGFKVVIFGSRSLFRAQSD